jgi:hypothetical protein
MKSKIATTTKTTTMSTANIGQIGVLLPTTTTKALAPPQELRYNIPTTI